MCDQISTKGPAAPLFFAILDLFICIGILGFHDFWVHQSKVKGARPSVEIMCIDFLEGWVSPTY